MSESKPMRAFERELVSFLGPKMAKFIERCDPSHPELLAGPLRDTFSEAAQLAEIARFCGERGMSFPVARISNCLPRSWPLDIFKARFLKEPYRSLSRSQKRPFSVVSQHFSRALSQLLVDLPSDFSHLFDDKSEHRQVWSSLSILFRSVGCQNLSSKSEEIAGISFVGPMGFRPVGLNFAAMVLCKRMRFRVVGEHARLSVVDFEGKPASVVARPVGVLSKSDLVPVSVTLSESAMDGRPIFDHHIVVCAQGGKIFLGERDGIFYFVGEDYSD